MVRLACIYGDRASSFAPVLAPLSRLNKLPVIREPASEERPADPAKQLGIVNTGTQPIKALGEGEIYISVHQPARHDR